MSASSSYRRPLLPRLEAALMDGAQAALWLMALARVAAGYINDGHLWLLDMQIAAALLLCALIRLCGLYLPRSLSFVGQLLGAIAWITAASLVPRFGWPREGLPNWQLMALGAFFLLTLIIHSVLRQRWLRRLKGHGFEWMLDWARERPYYARQTAARTMRILGFHAESGQ
jgi:hypothetical protein